IPVVGNVDAAADEAEESVRGRVERRRPVEQPAPAAVPAPQAELDFERPPVPESLATSRERREILRVNAGSPALARLLLESAACQIEPRRIEVGATLPRHRNPDRYLQTVQRRREVCRDAGDLSPCLRPAGKGCSDHA